MKKNDMFMERYGKNDFFCHKATCFLDELWSTVLLYYCTTTIFMYRVFACYIFGMKTRKHPDSPAIFVRNFANRPIKQNSTVQDHNNISYTQWISL
jgi:hypothetical protein